MDREYSQRALVLFDIDGTLLRRAGPHHRQALIDAVRRVTGVETTTEGVPVQGMLDRDILACMLANAGVSRTRIRRHMPAMVALAQRIYVRSCPDLRRRVCPGARMLLYKLEEMPPLSSRMLGVASLVDEPCTENGRVAMAGTGKALLADQRIVEAYLGG